MAAEGPPLHEYEFAPLAVSVAACPAQITVLLAVTLSAGNAFTESVFTAEPEQPVAVTVPVTTYVAFETGLTV
jgi:hypothetical protein